MYLNFLQKDLWIEWYVVKYHQALHSKNVARTWKFEARSISTSLIWTIAETQQVAMDTNMALQGIAIAYTPKQSFSQTNLRTIDIECMQ